jgi:hypothetical protein
MDEAKSLFCCFIFFAKPENRHIGLSINAAYQGYLFVALLEVVLVDAQLVCPKVVCHRSAGGEAHEQLLESLGHLEALVITNQYRSGIFDGSPGVGKGIVNRTVV